MKPLWNQAKTQAGQGTCLSHCPGLIRTDHPAPAQSTSLLLPTQEWGVQGTPKSNPRVTWLKAVDKAHMGFHSYTTSSCRAS